MKNLFIIPTKSCQSYCSYCFGPNEDGPVMDMDIIKKTLTLFLKYHEQAENKTMSICFHGGEPLLAGIKFYEKTLAIIRNMFGDTIQLGIQSNLWELTDAYCKLFKEYRVGIGTSLDGPEDITDMQRGKGYYKKTMMAIDLLYKYGLGAGCIATITQYSMQRIQEVFEFFSNNSLPFEVHSAVRPFTKNKNDKVYLSAEQFGNLLIQLLNLYLKNINKIKIETLDTLIRNVSGNKSGLCTFTQCLGEYVAVSPDGGLYTCNRFVSKKEFLLGNIKDIEDLLEIKRTDAWNKLETWQNNIKNKCKSCLYYTICYGGCPYTAFSRSDSYNPDPNCKAYKMIYSHILDKGTDEFFSDENLSAVMNEKFQHGKSSLFKKGNILHMMSHKPHPFDIANTAKKIIAGVVLGIFDDLEKVINNLSLLGIIKDREKGTLALERLMAEVKNPRLCLNNIYLHITSKCNLHCSHCYAAKSNTIEHLPLVALAKLIKAIPAIKFRKIVITGGEPLLYKYLKTFLNQLINIRKIKRLPLIFLRTNLNTTLSEEIINFISLAFDQVIISIEGSEEYHNKRRGEDSYKKVIDNLELFPSDIRKKKMSIATVFDFGISKESYLEDQKNHLLLLKDKYKIKRIQFLPLLPLGRAKGINTKRPEAREMDVIHWMENKNFLRSSCGIGYNLMISPDGNAYPCHVFENKSNLLGNILKTDIKSITESERFKQLQENNVDSDELIAKLIITPLEKLPFFCHLHLFYNIMVNHAIKNYTEI